MSVSYYYIAFVTFLAFNTWNDHLHKDEKMHQGKINSLFQKNKNWEDMRTMMMEEKKNVEIPTYKLKPQLKKNFTKLITKDGPFFKSAFTSFSGLLSLDQVFIFLLIHTCGADLAVSISTVYNNITLGSVIVGLAFNAPSVFAVYKWNRVQREFEKQNRQLQKEKREEQEVKVRVVNTLMEQKKELENQKAQLKEFLENMETQREENKQKLQSVEEEIREKEMTFNKPEELLREKENLLREQWKLDQIKKDNERQLLNIEKLLEPIEMQEYEGRK